MARRRFLAGVAASVAGTLVTGRVAFAGDLPASNVLIPGKDSRLIVYGESPTLLETPLALLADEVTPTPLVFVRNNSQPADAATMKPPRLAGWKIELAGQVDRPRTLDAQDLAEMPQVEHEMVLQCSGNSRALFSEVAPVSGTQWGRGAMANVRFAGVELAKVVERLGVTIKPEARFLTAAGADDPPADEDDFEHSIPLADSLGKSLLALRLNGQPLPAIHGGPVRLIIPGYYGTMQMKWLTQLRFEPAETDHSSQVPRYRTPLVPIEPGRDFQFTVDNSEPNWRMKIKCVVLSPEPGAKLPAGDVVAQGVAFNDGEARIDSVLVSTDQGQTWRKAQLDVPTSPYAWYRWQAKLPLSSGKHQIWARAVDALGRTQPMDGAIHWNPKGYTWNGVEKIDVVVG